MMTDARIHDSRLRFIGSWTEDEKALLRATAEQITARRANGEGLQKPWVFTHQVFGPDHFYFAQWLHHLEHVLVAYSLEELVQRLEKAF